MHITRFPNGPRPSLLRRLTAPSVTEGKGLASPSCPQDKLLDVGLEGAWLLLWLRVPFPSLTASAEGVEGAGMFSTDSVQIFQDL